jgi:hypothetical protein
MGWNSLKGAIVWRSWPGLSSSIWADQSPSHHIIQSRIVALEAIQLGTRKRPLEELLCRFRHWQSGDPRDIVYSLLALTDLRSVDIRVDYKRSAVAVLVDAVEHTMHSGAALTLIGKPWAPDIPGLPSWIIPSMQNLQVHNNDYGGSYRKQNNPDLDGMYSSALRREMNARIVRPDEQTASSLQIFPSYALIASGITLYDRKLRESRESMIWLDQFVVEKNFTGFTDEAKSSDAREPDDRLVFLFGGDQALLLSHTMNTFDLLVPG